jgi:hypothetical protein
MTGMIRKATILVALGLVAATVATAGIPSAATSIRPAFVDLVACDGAGALPTGARYIATITVNDIAGTPVVGAQVAAAFCSDVAIYSVIPGGAVVGSTFTNTAVTNSLGQVSIVVSGAGKNASGASVGGDGANCVTWFANGVNLGTSSVATYDQDGKLAVASQGLSANDLTRAAQDLLAVPGVYKPRTDFDHNGSLGANDLTFFAQYILAVPAYVSSCGTLN